VLPNKRTSAGLITTLLDVLPPVFSLLTRFGSLAAASDRLLLACLASLAALVLSVSPCLRTRLSSHLARYPSSLFPSFSSCTPPTLLFLFLLFVVEFVVLLTLSSSSLVWIEYSSRYTIESLLVGRSAGIISLISCLNASLLDIPRGFLVAFVRHGKLGKRQEQ